MISKELMADRFTAGMRMALQWKIDDHLFELILKLNSLSLCTFEISKHNALIVFID